MDYLFKTFYNILAGMLDLLPEGNIPDQIETSLTTLTSYIQYANNFIAVDTIWDILQVSFVLFGVLLTFKIVFWIYALIKGDG
jgi:hypothetical protein